MARVTFEDDVKNLRARLDETLSDLRLHQHQSEELRRLLRVQKSDQTESINDVWKLKYEALNERKQELQEENAELRRQLAGLTPNRQSGKFSSPYSHCTGCVCLKRQKARQSKFYEKLILDSRHQISVYQSECAKLKTELKESQESLASIQNKYEEINKKQSESLNMYKLRSNRLERRNTFELKGYAKEIEFIKSKLKDIDRCLAKAQLSSISSGVKQDVLNDLVKITSKSLALTDKLHLLSKRVG